MPSGTRINGEFLTTLFDDTPDAVKQFQVHQQTDGSIVLKVIPNIKFQDLEQTLENVKNNLLNAINHEVPIAVEKVDSIPQKGGKLKFIISDYKK